MLPNNSTATQSQFATTTELAELRQLVGEAKSRGESVGCVPTMGALHAGHLSLIQAARETCDYVVTTIFVNPTQFGPNEDFDKYPRPWETDLEACRQAAVDLVFHPPASAVYPPDDQTCVDVGQLANVLEGACRPGHFRGVTTVVLKLLNMVLPDVVFFGRKDYQQQLIIRQMCRDLHVPVEIVTCPTIREEDGLALSSRNVYLSPSERKSGLALSQSLQLARDLLQRGEQDVTSVRKAMHEHLNLTSDVKVDYATVAHPDTLEEIAAPLPEMVALVAARVGATRLIDNLPIHLDR